MAKLNIAVNLLLIAAAIALATEYLLMLIGFPSWCYYVVILVLAITFYFAGCGLIRYYIMKRAPEFAGDEEVFPGIQKWELTAGTGTVPTWVSWVGLFSFACLISLALPFMSGLVKEKPIEVVPGIGIAGVNLGMSDQQVRSELGTPHSELTKQDIERAGGARRTIGNGQDEIVPAQETEIEKIVEYRKPSVTVLIGHDNSVARLSLSYCSNVTVRGYSFLKFKYLSQEELSRLGIPDGINRMKNSEQSMMAQAPPGTIYEYYEYWYDSLGMNLGLLFDRTKEKNSKHFIGVNHIDVYHVRNR